ncbi:SDR family oxidoreductase [Paracoccaceae bacterium]|nr:SDR family oxidoreductase [Paracoccaceae bacterium]
MSKNLKKKVCLITGARTGIGLSIGLTLAKNGYRVIFSGRSVNDCKDTVDVLMARGFEAVETQIDLSNLSSLKQQTEIALSIWGTVDVLINNGAVIEPINSLEKLELQHFEKAIRVNYLAPSLLISYCWSNLVKNKGKVINILSGASINAIEGWTAYCSTKAALHMINQQTHLEGNQYGISSIGLSPGMVDTGMQGKIRASGINQVSKVRKEDLINSKKTGLFALWCASSDANEFSGKMISENDQIVSAKYKAWINNQMHTL